MPTSSGAPIDAAFDRWLAELLDLSKRNQLLYFRPGRGNLPLTHPPVDRLFDGLANKGHHYTFYRDDTADQGAATTVNDQLELFLDAGPSPDGDADSTTAGTPASKPARTPRQNEIVASGDPQRIDATLYRLRLRARSALLEQGINVLFVAFGTLEWAEGSTSDERILSPLLLVPVRLDRDTALDPYTMAPLDEDLLFNPTLARKLELDFVSTHLPGPAPA
ncbi:MAG TPA: DUF4011 domain-containing protein, partial [Chloroflexota bacterium]